MNKRTIIDCPFLMLNTTVFRKDTYNDLFLHWDSFSRISWKRGTLKLLISRVYMICSNQSLLEKELKHLKNTFHKKNGYPLWMINQIVETASTQRLFQQTN